MTAIMNNSSSLLDFFDIAVDAYESKKTDIYRKIMTTLIASYKKLLHDIEIENSDLEKVNSLTINEEELELYYDNIYDMVDMIKLLKSHLLPLKDHNGLFADLYQVADKLHDAFMLHIDLISMQEVRELQNRYAKAS
ncbi:MAG: hypothetical protein L3J47_07685 [Sulfurovum sp.]|nr:hypothetical protein [Sulfurovum sp.]